VGLCAASPDNPRYALIQGDAFSVSVNPGVVFYDVTLLNAFDGIDPFGDTFVLAHELGHQVQYDNSSRAEFVFPQVELQADCLGGIYFGYLSVTDPQFMTTDVQGVAEGICGIAVGKNLSWANIASHGTCEQRAGAFAKGALAELNAEANKQSFDPFLVCSF